MDYGRDKNGTGCWNRRDDAQLFSIANTRSKRAFVVAGSTRCARWIAMWAGHIREMQNGQVFVVRQDWLSADEPFQSALRRAVKAGFPGLIVRVGDAATILPSSDHGIKGQVYTPISSL